MSELSQRVNIYVCRYLNVKCRKCNSEITGKPCTGKSNNRRYCIPCAIILRIVTRQDCIDAGIEVPLKKIVNLYKKQKISFSHLMEYGIKKSEVLQFA